MPMVEIGKEAVFILAAYLYGSIPFIWARAKFKRVNLEEYGRSIGGSTLYKAAGIPAMLLGGVGDFSKGVLPVAIGYYVLHFPLGIACLAGIAAIIGQCWPIFLKFRGGRGGATSIGIAATLLREMILIAFIPFIVGFLWHWASRRSRQVSSRIVPLGFLASFALLPLVSYLFGKPQETTLTFAFVFLLIIIRRLTADLGRDLRERSADESVGMILLTRFLYDRSPRDRYD